MLTLPNSASNPTLTFNLNDPLEKLSLGSNFYYGTNALSELGLKDGITGPAYDSLTSNMASKFVKANFIVPMSAYDSFGSKHLISEAYIKIGKNMWAYEDYISDPKEIMNGRLDGLLAYGVLKFNGDGSLNSVSENIINPIGIEWSNGATISSITINRGTAGPITGEIGTILGTTEGIRQQDDDFIVNFAEQNGFPPGLLTSVNFKENGNVNAIFSNEMEMTVFKLPLAEFYITRELKNRGGHSFSETFESGSYNLKVPGHGGVGNIMVGKLENSPKEDYYDLNNSFVFTVNFTGDFNDITISTN